MGIKGGARPGAGRKKGSQNKKTLEQVAAVEASGLTPLEFMLSILRDQAAPIPERFEAAKAAAPYVHAKLASTETNLKLVDSYVAMMPAPAQDNVEWLNTSSGNRKKAPRPTS